MIVQLDIDDTITAAPEFFAWLSQALRRDGHTVLVVTSRVHSLENFKTTAEELRDFGIVFDKLIMSPEPDDIDPRRLPPDLHPAHRVYINKVIAAEDCGTDILFDDCSITSHLFQRSLPHVKVFRPIFPAPR